MQSTERCCWQRFKGLQRLKTQTHDLRTHRLKINNLTVLIYKYYFAKVINPKEEDCPVSVFGYIRKNDEAMMKSAVTTLEAFREEFLLLVSSIWPFSWLSWLKHFFKTILGLLGEIDDPDGFLAKLYQKAKLEKKKIVR
jgi:hypothetical protein